MRVKFSRYDAADYLKTEQDIAAYLNAVAQEGEPSLIAIALGDVAHARNLSQLARDAGINRDDLSRVLSGAGDPRPATLMKIARAMGLQISLKPIGDVNNRS